MSFCCQFFSCSNFSDIFDVDWFIMSLQPYLPVIKELPANLSIAEDRVFSMRVPRRCSVDYYRRRVFPILQKYKVRNFNDIIIEILNVYLKQNFIFYNVWLQRLRMKYAFSCFIGWKFVH